jgi:predicted RNA-binding protein with TRAM domain
MDNVKIRTFSIALLILLLSGVACASATTVSIAGATVEPGDAITLPITVSEITDYGTGTIEIEYNSSVVHVTDVTNGPRSQVAAYYVNNTPGLAQISASNLYGVSGDIIFANVTFKAIGAGSTPLNLNVTLLGDISYNEIPATVSNGSIEIALGSIPGDVNDDKQLTTADAAIVIEMAARGKYLQMADVNGDHTVTSIDALMILQTLACEEDSNKS